MSDKNDANSRSAGSDGLMWFSRAVNDRRPLGMWASSVLITMLALCLILPILGDRATAQITEARTPARTPGMPTPNPSPREAPPDWQVYTDVERGYSIRYPPGWHIQEPSEGPEHGIRVDFVPVGAQAPGEVTAVLSVVVYENAEGLSAEQWVQRRLASFPTEVASNVVTETCQVGGRPGLEAVGMPSRLGTLEIFLAEGSRMYRFILTPYQPAEPSLAEVLPDINTLMDLSVPSFRLLAQ